MGTLLSAGSKAFWEGRRVNVHKWEKPINRVEHEARNLGRSTAACSLGRVRVAFPVVLLEKLNQLILYFPSPWAKHRGFTTLTPETLLSIF